MEIVNDIEWLKKLKFELEPKQDFIDLGYDFEYVRCNAENRAAEVKVFYFSKNELSRRWHCVAEVNGKCVADIWSPSCITSVLAAKRKMTDFIDCISAFTEALRYE